MAFDTSPEMQQGLVEIWRAMTPSQELEIVAELNRDTDRMAEAGVRSRHPEATDRDVVLRVAALRNGRDLSVAAFGWNPELEG